MDQPTNIACGIARHGVLKPVYSSSALRAFVCHCTILEPLMFVLCPECAFVDLCTSEVSINIFNSANLEPSVVFTSLYICTYS